MPIFEYKCLNCGKKTEILDIGASRQKRICPHCGSRKLEKQFSTFAPTMKAGDSKRCYECSDQTCPHAGS